MALLQPRRRGTLGAGRLVEQKDRLEVLDETPESLT